MQIHPALSGNVQKPNFRPSTVHFDMQSSHTAPSRDTVHFSGKHAAEGTPSMSENTPAGSLIAAIRAKDFYGINSILAPRSRQEQTTILVRAQQQVNQQKLQGLGSEPLIFIAALMNNAEAIQALANVGANVNQADYIGTTPLHLAAQRNLVEALTALATAGANVNQPGYQGSTPLHMAAGAGHINALNTLITHGANVNQPDQRGSTPLHLAAHYNQTKAIKALAEARADLNRRDMIGDTALHVAALHDQAEAIDELIKAGAPVDQLDNLDNTPLHAAAERGQISAIEHLINKGANVNQIGHNGNTPLHVAAKHTQPEAINVLVKAKGIDLNVLLNTLNDDGDTPLHMAAQHNQVIQDLEDVGINVAQLGNRPLKEIVQENSTVQEILSSAGIDVEQLGDMPFDEAIQSKQVEAINALIARGANVNHPGGQGVQYTPLHWAAAQGHVGAIKALANADGIDLNQYDKQGYTALHLAAKQNKAKAVEALVKGIRVDQPNREGDTALHMAARHNQVIQDLEDVGINVAQLGNRPLKEIVQENSTVQEILSSAGIDVEQLGDMPFDEAIQSKQVEAINALIARGANVNHPGRQQDEDDALYTPLHWAAREGHSKVIEALAKAGGIDLNPLDNDGNTPLHAAAEDNQPKAIKALIRAGVPVDQPDDVGATSLHVAAENGHTEAIQALIEARANVNQADTNNNHTPLQRIEAEANFRPDEKPKYLESALQLLSGGANPDPLTPDFHKEVLNYGYQRLLTLPKAKKINPALLQRYQIVVLAPNDIINKQRQNLCRNATLQILAKGADTDHLTPDFCATVLNYGTKKLMNPKTQPEQVRLASKAIKRLPKANKIPKESLKPIQEDVERFLQDKIQRATPAKRPRSSDADVAEHSVHKRNTKIRHIQRCAPILNSGTLDGPAKLDQIIQGASELGYLPWLAKDLSDAPLDYFSQVAVELAQHYKDNSSND